MEARQIILTAHQIEQKIRRIATQIVEQNFDETELILAGIQEEGMRLAMRLKQEIEKLGRQQCLIISVLLDKNARQQPPVYLDPDTPDLVNKVVILVDDVINSGRTLAFALQPFTAAPLKKIQVAVLVHRTHKAFPIAADYVGLSLATTIENSIRVTLAEAGSEMAYLL